MSTPGPNPVCVYCGETSTKTTGAAIYPHLPELSSKVFYLCSKCDAYVGCHPGTDTPLGNLADATLRKRRMAAHNAFDSLWKGQRLWGGRSNAYYRLSELMHIPEDKCHVGMFNLEQCADVIKICNEYNQKDSKGRKV